MADRQKWISHFRAYSSKNRGPKNRKQLAFEQMEDRLTPATPVVLSINPAAPTTTITNATSVTYAVTFGEAVTGVDAADFKVATNGTVQTATPFVVAGSGATYTVKINGIAGAGELRLDLLDNDTIVGGSGPLGGAG